MCEKMVENYEHQPLCLEQAHFISKLLIGLLMSDVVEKSKARCQQRRYVCKKTTLNIFLTLATSCFCLFVFSSLVTQQLPKTESFPPYFFFFCPCEKRSHNTGTSVPETFVIFITQLINMAFESGDCRNSCQVFSGLQNGKWKTGQINIK